jgi:hypothetical protein
MDITTEAPVVYTAQSKLKFFCRDVVCEFVLRQNAVPLNPFRVFDYFLNDRVERDLVRRGNNNIVRMADETWVFGPVSNGVLFEVQYATRLGKKVRYFTIGTTLKDIFEIAPEDVEFEEELLSVDGYEEATLRRTVNASLGALA